MLPHEFGSMSDPGKCARCGAREGDGTKHCPEIGDQVMVPKRVLAELTDNAKRHRNRADHQRRKKMKWMRRARIAEIQVKALREETERLYRLLGQDG